MASRPAARRSVGLVALAAILALTLVLRLADLQLYTAGDESRWVQRASDFWAVLTRKNDPDRSFIIGHPGVTVMWTALAGMGRERAEAMRFGARGTDVTRDAAYMSTLGAARQALAVANSLLLVMIVMLAWRLVALGPALIGGLLLATDPFLIGYSQLVHLDATVAGYMSVALLSACIYWWKGGGVGYLVISGVAGGLALLTKAPSLYLLGFVPLLASGGMLVARRQGSTSAILRLVLELFAWVVLAGAVAALIWPAFSVDPVGTFRKVVEFATSVGTAGHDNFLFGQPTDDPGWLYYPVALVFRLGVGVLVGLVALAVWSRRSTGLPASVRPWALILGVYALGFWVLMEVGSKKFDRYLIPLIPILGLLAGLGWWAVYRTATRRARWLGVAVVGAALVLQLGPALAVRPYYLAYYNPLVGGGPVAAQALLVGWGEGLDQVANYLNGLPDGGQARVGIHDNLRDHLQALVDGLVVKREGGATYLVDYVSMRQREQVFPRVLECRPEHHVWINGIEYARIYRIDQGRCQENDTVQDVMNIR